MTKKRVLLKISGLSLGGGAAGTFDATLLNQVADEIAPIVPTHELAVLVGGGNIMRGSEQAKKLDLSREEEVRADHFGMLGTMINGGMLEIMLQRRGVQTRLMFANEYQAVGEHFNCKKALHHLDRGRVIILGGGTGNPRFTTDSAAVLRAREIGASMVLKGTNVDGIYTKDPVEHPNAELLERITPRQFVAWEIGKILDATAVTLADANNLEIRVFNIFRSGTLADVLVDRGRYSVVSKFIAASI